MTKTEQLQHSIENKLAEVIGGIVLAEGACARVRLGLEKFGAEDCGTSLADAMELLARANRELGHLTGLVRTAEMLAE